MGFRRRVVVGMSKMRNLRVGASVLRCDSLRDVLNKARDKS